MQLTFKRFTGIIGGLALLFALPGLISTAIAQDMESGGLPAHTYVTVHSKADPAPAVTKANLQLKESGKPVQVTGWSQVESSGKSIELAFVIDDSLRGTAGVQMNDVKTFFQGAAAERGDLRRLYAERACGGGYAGFYHRPRGCDQGAAYADGRPGRECQPVLLHLGLRTPVAVEE